MAKLKSKVYAPQREKAAIQTAKRLKEKGILQKTTKLHGGKFISKGVLRKVREYKTAANLGYGVYKAPKSVVEAAKARGFQTVGGTKIIGPRSTSFRNRLKQGLITGVRPVRGGMMEEVELPHSIMDMYSLEAALGASGFDSLKDSHEYFAFKFYGNESHATFADSLLLLDYLRQYRGIYNEDGSIQAKYAQEHFRNLSIFRLHPDYARQNIRSKEQRLKERKSSMSPTGRIKYHKTQAEKLAGMHPDRAARFLKRQKARDTARRTMIVSDPKAYNEYKKKAAARAKKSRDNKKG